MPWVTGNSPFNMCQRSGVGYVHHQDLENAVSQTRIRGLWQKRFESGELGVYQEPTIAVRSASFSPPGTPSQVVEVDGKSLPRPAYESVPFRTPRVIVLRERAQGRRRVVVSRKAVYIALVHQKSEIDERLVRGLNRAAILSNNTQYTRRDREEWVDGGRQHFTQSSASSSVNVVAQDIQVSSETNLKTRMGVRILRQQDGPLTVKPNAGSVNANVTEDGQVRGGGELLVVVSNKDNKTAEVRELQDALLQFNASQVLYIHIDALEDIPLAKVSSPLLPLLIELIPTVLLPITRPTKPKYWLVEKKVLPNR